MSLTTHTRHAFPARAGRSGRLPSSRPSCAAPGEIASSPLAADRQVANTLAELIIGGALVSIDIGNAAAGTTHASADDRVTRQQGSEDPAVVQRWVPAERLRPVRADPNDAFGLH